jgi:hypothetical protein
MHILSNLEKLELARRFPAAFRVGCGIGATIPVITLGAKVAGQNVHWGFWFVAFLGGLVSLMSLYTFGVGSFGSDVYGRRKAFAFCGLIEFSWLALPYHLPPSDKPLYGVEVDIGLQWFFLSISSLGFLLAVLVNGVEIAATMAEGWEQSMARRESERQERERQAQASKGAAEEQASRWRAMQEFIQTLHAAKQRPRLKIIGTKYIMTDALAGMGEMEIFDASQAENPHTSKSV